MTRVLKAFAMLLTLPILCGFMVVFAYALIGIETDVHQTYERVFSYTVGTIVGWLIWGER